VGGAGGSVRGGCGSGRAGREVGLGDLPSLPLARREPVEGLPKTGENMGRRRTGSASIPAPGDGVGMVEGGAVPGPRTRETVFEAEAGEARSPTPVRGEKEGEKT
jgi:hypothetical protein